MKKNNRARLGLLVIWLLLTIAPAANAAKGNEGPDAGHAVGNELLELYRARIRQLEPITDVESLPGYAEIVQPRMQNIYRILPTFHFQMTQALANKNWFFVGGELPLDKNLGLNKDLRDLTRVGRQTNAMVELLKPWFYDKDVTDETRGALILHEMVVAAARINFSRSETGRPNATDVETLVAVLVKDPNITFQRLLVLLKELGFIHHSSSLEAAVPLSLILQDAHRSGYGYSQIRLAQNHQKSEFFVIDSPTLRGQPLEYHEGYVSYPMNIFFDICAIFFGTKYRNVSSIETEKVTSLAKSWILGAELPLTQSEQKAGRRLKAAISRVTCTRAPYYKLEVDIDLGQPIIVAE
ncbi:MAG: hypothetical protein AB7N80_14820 [Bdellovibrionales bacterium]